jgi:hypothetical protein
MFPVVPHTVYPPIIRVVIINCEFGLCSEPETFREHSGNIRGTFGEHSGNIQGTFREH